MCESVCVASGSQMVSKNYWPKLEVKSYKMELLLRYVWRVVESDPNIDFKEALKKWVPFITKCGCGTQEKTKSLQDKLVCSLLKLWQSMGGGTTENDISYLLLFIERTRTEKKRLNFLANFNRLKMRYKVNYLKEQEVLCVNKGCVEHMQELENLLVMIPDLNVEDAVTNIQQEKNGYCVHGLSTLKTMENDVELQINELERGDGEYMGMLTQADEMWIEMEKAFKKSIEVTKEMENTLSSELLLVEKSLSKWKEKCAIAEEDEKKALEINEELQTAVNENTRQSEVLDQELVELSTLSSQVNKNLQNMKTDHGETMQKLRTEKENYKKNITCLEDALKVKQLCTEKKCQAYDEKILDARHELAKCCKYFLQQSQQREKLLVEAKKMNDGKITCAKRCLDSRALIESQKQKIISEINEMKDNNAKILLKNICNCKRSTNNCNCVQCKKQKCALCCCMDLKNQFFRNIFKVILIRLRVCNCDVDSGIVADLNSVLQCNTSPTNETMLLKTFLLDLVISDLDISVSEGLQVTRQKVPVETRANVRMCLALPEEEKIVEDDKNHSDLMLQVYSKDENDDLDVDHLESKQGSETEQNEELVSKPESPIGSAVLESQNDDSESVKAEPEYQEDTKSLKAELDSLNEDLESVKNKSESQSDYSKSGITESEASDKDLELEKSEFESQNEQPQSNNAEAEFKSEDLASLEIKAESLQEEVEETISATKSYREQNDFKKDGMDVDTCSKCSQLSKTYGNDTEKKKCPIQIPCANLSRPSKSDSLNRTYKKKPGVNELDTCDCATKQNIFIQNKLVDPKTFIHGKMKQNSKYSKNQENTCHEKKNVCNCMSEFRRNDLTPRKSRSCKTNLTPPTNEHSGKYNVSSMYFDILEKNKHKFSKISSNLLCPYDSPNYKSKQDYGERGAAETVANKRLTKDNNEYVKKKTISNLERCLQASIVRKFVPSKQKSKAVNTEMTCKNVIKKRRMKKGQV